MRDPVMKWVREVVATGCVRPPILEVGSLDVNGSVRSLFPQPYVGVDMRPGRGVDVVADIMDPGFTCPLDRLGEWPRTAVLVETLEHVRRPHEALARLEEWLEPGGLIIVTAVFDFPIHDYPEDYWRMTPAGLRVLLEDAGFIGIAVQREMGAGPEWDPVGVFGTGRKRQDGP